MNTEQALRLTESFALVAPRAEAIVDRFYERLFAKAPGVRGMFPKDMTTQKQHLLAAVGLVAKNAARLESLEKPLMEMGARHVGYGAKNEHYPVVRDTLLETLAEFAGGAWTSPVAEAWTTALNTVAGFMIRGAEEFVRGEKRKAA